MYGNAHMPLVLQRHAGHLTVAIVTAGLLVLAPPQVRAQATQAAPPAADGNAAARAIADSVRIARIARAERDARERNKTFKFGVSLGWRHRIGHREDFYRDAVLNPADSTVQVDTIDSGDVVVSAVMVAYPWKQPGPDGCKVRCGNLWRLGFVANVDLASFAGDETTTFNESIQGGGGLAWRLGDDFSLAMTIERVFSRRLRSYVKPGEKLPVAPGATAEPFARDSDTWFRDDNLTAFSAKFVYFFK